MKKFEISQGRHPLVIETGRMAKQADGSVLMRYADTMVLVTACVTVPVLVAAGGFGLETIVLCVTLELFLIVIRS